MISTLFLALHLLELIDLNTAVLALFILGASLLFFEFFITSFGIMAFNGILALFIGYSLQNGQSEILGMPLDWPFFFGIAFIEALILGGLIAIIMHFQGKKPTTGTESMVGADAEIVTWKKNKGSVRIQGEIWKATSDQELDLTKEDIVVVESIEKLSLAIKTKT